MAEGLYIFTASHGSAVSNLAKSVWRPVPSEACAEVPLSKAPLGMGIFAWGVANAGHNLQRWRNIVPGDWVLFVAHKRYIARARVLGTGQFPDFARELWDGGADGRTWELVTFLERPVKVAATIEDLGRYLVSHYQGFSKISDDRMAKIRDEFGSVERFLADTLPEQRSDENEVTMQDVLQAVRDFEAGEGSEFGPVSVYEVVVEGRTYPPKAIFALASRRTVGRTLRPEEVGSGESSFCFYALSSLGLQVRRRDS